MRERAARIVVACELTAVLFVLLTVLATQDKAVRAASPWQDDPYDVMVSLAQFAVPVLIGVIGLRLLAWRAPGSPDREHQSIRAAAALLGLIAATLGFEWAAVIANAHASAWNAATVGLIAGLVVMSVLVSVLAIELWRRRRPSGASRAWQHDWLGDVIWLSDRIPILRRWARPAAAQWVRSHAMTVFVALSLIVAAGIVGAQAVSEEWTDPLLISWAVVVAATSYLAFSVISNHLAGFIARPQRSRSRRIAEASVVAGCLATQFATGFRDAIWSIFASGPVTSVPDLVVLTLGAGLCVGVASAALLYFRAKSRDPREAPL